MMHTARQQRWPVEDDQFLVEPPTPPSARDPKRVSRSFANISDAEQFRQRLACELHERQQNQSDVFARFWCIHGQNLMARNLDILAKIAQP
jgi:hypothetical protein